MAAGGRAGLQQVLLGPGGRFQRGDQFLPDRVQRRVGDLGKQLGEVVEQEPWPVGQHGDRRVGAHGADRLDPGGGHRPEQQPQFLLGVAAGPLPGDELGGAGQGADPVGQVVEVRQAGMQPFGVRVLGGQRRLDVGVLEDPVAAGVGEEDPARLQPALAHHGGRVEVQHPDLAGQDDQAVLGHPVPARAQAVAVEHRADDRAVGERDARRAVPGFHQRGVELVERAPRRVHLVVVLPRLRDHHEDGVRQRPAAEVEQFQALVEAGGVAGRLGQDRQQPLQPPAVRRAGEQAGGQHRLARPHPVAVAAHRVDLAVVRDEPVRVGTRPGRHRVRGEPGVDQGQGGGVRRVGQVRVERRQLQRGEHPLVDDRRRGQAGRVQAGVVLHPLAQAECPPVEGQPGAAARCGDEQLRQAGHRGPRARSAVPVVAGDVPPAEDGQALLCGQFGDRRPGPGALGGIGGQEDKPGGVVAGRGQAELTGGAEQGVRHLGQDARPVAGIRVAALGAAMVEIPQHGERLGHGLVCPAAGQVRDKADAARVVLEPAVIQARARCRVASRVAPSGRWHEVSCRLDFAFGADRDDIGPAAGSTGDAASGSVSYRSGITSRLRHPCVLARAGRVVKPQEPDKFLLVTGTRR